MTVDLTRIASDMLALPQAAPTSSTMSVKEQIRVLKPAIKSLRDKDWKWPAIADFLKTNGIEISHNTLRLYFFDSSPRARKRKASTQTDVAPSTSAPVPAESKSDAQPAHVKTSKQSAPKSSRPVNAQVD